MSQFERNFQLLIGKDVTANATSLADLDSGEIVVVKEDGTLMAAGETLADSASIKIVQGTNIANGAGTGYLPKFSAKIQGTNVKRWMGQSYTAATQQVDTITLAGLDALDILRLTIIMTSDKVTGSERQIRKVFELAATGTEATDATAMAALVNSDDYMKQVLTASTNGADLILTAKAQTYNGIDSYEQVTFISTFYWVDATSSVETIIATVTTKPAFPVGTPSKIKDIEKLAKANEGITNFIKWPIPTGAATEVLDTENYDVYVIEHDDVHPSADLNGQIASPQKTIIAIPYDAAGGNGAALEAILNPYFASCPGAFANVNL